MAALPLAAIAQSTEAAQRIAGQHRVTLPSEPDARGAALLDELNKASVPAFDRAYTRAALEENRREVRRFRQAAGSTSEDRRLRTFASAQLSALEQDLREARATADAHRG